MRYYLSVAVLFCISTPTSAVTINWVPVGNAGNAADPLTGHGAVAYSYSIDKYDVTVGQYTEFLNAVAATDPYGLYKTKMTTDVNTAGISRSGSSGSYTYSVIGNSANLPITYVNWGDAARFANWLQNGQPTAQAQQKRARTRLMGQSPTLHLSPSHATPTLRSSSPAMPSRARWLTTTRPPARITGTRSPATPCRLRYLQAALPTQETSEATAVPLPRPAPRATTVR